MRLKRVKLNPVVTAGAYSANDVVGATLNFGNVDGMLRAVTIVDQAKQAGAYQLVLFRDLPTDIADNGTFDIADADLPNIIGAIHITDTAGADKFDFTDNKIYCRQGLALPITDISNLYGFLIALATPTYAAVTDVHIQLLLEEG